VYLLNFHVSLFPATKLNFLQFLGSLPGVDPNDPGIQSALRNLNADKDKKDEAKKDEDKK